MILGQVSQTDAAGGQPGPGFYISWIVVSAAGGALVTIAVSTFSVVGILFSGALFATPQWLVLRLWMPRASRWVHSTALSVLGGLATAAATVWPVGVPVVSMLNLPDRLMWVYACLVAGGIVGSIQMLIVPVRVTDPRWWVPVSALGVLALVAVPMQIIAGAGIALKPAELGLVGGAAYGMATAIPLGRLIRRPKGVSVTVRDPEANS